MCALNLKKIKFVGTQYGILNAGEKSKKQTKTNNITWRKIQKFSCILFDTRKTKPQAYNRRKILGERKKPPHTVQWFRF